MRKAVNHLCKALCLLIILCACLFSSACVRLRANTTADPDALRRVAETYGKNAASPGASVRPVKDAASAKQDRNDNNEAGFIGDVAVSLYERDFDTLEKTSQEARNGKTRFAGGAWKISDFYIAIEAPRTGDDAKATDADWQALLNAIQDWVKAKPESVTARIALANAYTYYGFYARGAGYANTVSDKGWYLFNDRAALASSLLIEAAKLKEKCPYWYEVAQQVALMQGWDKTKERELFEQAYAFEPSYYDYEINHADFLLPKWNGEKGETEAFAQAIANRIGGRQGDFVYFEVASIVACQCESQQGSLSGMSWPRVKKGYADLVGMYGVSAFKLNRFADMAYEAGDTAAAREAFSQIGENWRKDVWVNQANYEKAREWAQNSEVSELSK